MKKRIKKKDIDLIKEINLETIDEIIDLISNNRDNIGIYFFIGSGFYNYCANDKSDYTWSEMANKKFDNKLNIHSFTDFIYIDVDYKEKINEINKKRIESKNENLKKFWDEIANFNERTSKYENTLKILTTNHCNTIEKYFSINNTYYLEDLNSIEPIETEKYSILKIHNISEDDLIYDLNSYWKIFNCPNSNENYYKKLSQFFTQEFSRDRKNVIFIFGSSYSELHINILFKSIKDGENKIIWIRELDDILSLNRKFLYNKISIKEIKKFHKEYKNNNHLILFFNNSYKDISSDKIFCIMLEKWIEKFSNIMTFIESWKMNNESNLTSLDEDILNDFKQKEKIPELNYRLKQKEYYYLACILKNSCGDKEIIDWYFENIENTINTLININWFVELLHVQFCDKNLYRELMNKIIDKNINISQITSDFMLDIIEEIEVPWDNPKKWNWIIEFSIGKIIEIDKKRFYNTRSKFFNKIDDFGKFINASEIDNQQLKFIKNKIECLLKNSQYINWFKFIYYLYKLSNLIKRKINIINLILDVYYNKYNKSFIDLLSEINFLSHLFSFNNKIIAVIICLFKIYLINNKNIFDKILNNLNSDNLSFNLYVILRESKLLKEHLHKFKKNDIDNFEKILGRNFDSKNEISFFEKCKNILEDIKNKKYSNALDNINKLNDFKEITSFDFYHFVSNVFDNVILIINAKNINNNSLLHKIIRELNNLIINYKDFNANDSYDYFISYNKEFDELQLNIVVNIINYLIENNFIWYLNSFIHKFVFNGLLNPSFDFYYITNKKFPFIYLIKNIDNKKINLIDLFKKDKNIYLINLYYDVINKNIENWNDENTIFLKYIYDVYLIKNVNHQDIKKLIIKIFNSNFFQFIKEFRVQNQFNDMIVYLFISDSIKYIDNLEDFLSMYLSSNHLKYMEGHNNDYFLNFLKISFEKIDAKDINKIFKIFSCYFKETNSKKTFKINFEKIEDSFSFMKWMRKMYIREKREILSSYNEIINFCNEIFEIIEFTNKSNIEQYLTIIGNIILSILSIYKINDIKENIHNKKWDRIHPLMRRLDQTDIEELNAKKFVEEVKKFIIKNIK